jgi:competence protein ComEC
MSAFEVRVWDVGHGFSAWVQTPKGQSHWIDAGAKSAEFSPSAHAVRKGYIKKGGLDFLIISHSDSDHLTDLPELLENLGEPRTLMRNRNIPYEFKYRSGPLSDYQAAFKLLDEKYTSDTQWEVSPQNSAFNGGIEIKTRYLPTPRVSNSNNYSVVAVYQYKSVLVVFPGDIDDSGWQQLQELVSADWNPIINRSSLRFLVAPHHGRSSGYSDAMMKFFSPHVCVICDGYGNGETDNRFRVNPIGVQWNGSLTKYLTTKTSGRVLIRVDQSGNITLDQIEHQ